MSQTIVLSCRVGFTVHYFVGLEARPGGNAGNNEEGTKLHKDIPHRSLWNIKRKNRNTLNLFRKSFDPQTNPLWYFEILLTVIEICEIDFSASDSQRI